jgi:hypothetical protein
VTPLLHFILLHPNFAQPQNGKKATENTKPKPILPDTYTHVFGTPTFPKSWKPKFRKEQQSGSLGSQIKQKNVTAPHENNHPIKFLLSTSLGIGKLRFTKINISRAGNQQH